MLQGWYATLQNTDAQDLLRLGTAILDTTTEQLRRTQQTVTTVATGVPAVLNGSVRQAHQGLDRHFPVFYQTIKGIGGYEHALLEQQSIRSLHYLVTTCRVDPNYQESGRTALSAAVSGGPDQKERIQFLFEFCNKPGFNVHIRVLAERSRTLMHLLIAHKNEVLFIFFMEHARKNNIKINLSLKDDDQNTPLLLAIKMMQKGVALYILRQKKEYNLDVGMNQVDKEGRSALDCAIVLGEIEITHQLLCLGARCVAIKDDLSTIDGVSGLSIRAILHAVAYEPYAKKPEGFVHTDSLMRLEEQCLRNQYRLKTIVSDGIIQIRPILTPAYNANAQRAAYKHHRSQTDDCYYQGPRPSF